MEEVDLSRLTGRWTDSFRCIGMISYSYPTIACQSRTLSQVLTPPYSSLTDCMIFSSLGRYPGFLFNSCTPTTSLRRAWRGSCRAWTSFYLFILFECIPSMPNQPFFEGFPEQQTQGECLNPAGQKGGVSDRARCRPLSTGRKTCAGGTFD